MTDQSANKSEMEPSGNVCDFVTESQPWLAQDSSELIARWRIEIEAKLRGADGMLTCANLENPDAPISEAIRISDALMSPNIRKWLNTPLQTLLQHWKTHV